MERKSKTEGVRKLWDRYQFAVLVALIGVVLLLWPSGSERMQKTGRELQSSATPVTEIQQEMEEILGKISGVGQVRVMLTADTDGERQLAQDTELSYSGPATAPEDYSRRSETVVQNSGDGDETVVTQTLYPTYRGALVVCQGGENPKVRLIVTEAVAALTGLPADRISVAKWQ